MLLKADETVKGITVVPKQSGLTLIELLVVTGVLLALLLVAAPGYSTLIQNNRTLTETYALRASLNNARSEAITRRTPVVLCPTANGTTCNTTNDWGPGYMTFVDSDGDAARDPDEDVLQWEAREGLVRILSDVTDDLVIFSAKGTTLNSEGTFRLCDKRGAKKARALVLNPSGSVRGATDTSGTGTVNGAGGIDVTCT